MNNKIFIDEMFNRLENILGLLKGVREVEEEFSQSIICSIGTNKSTLISKDQGDHSESELKITQSRDFGQQMKVLKMNNATLENFLKLIILEAQAAQEDLSLIYHLSRENSLLISLLETFS